MRLILLTAALVACVGYVQCARLPKQREYSAEYCSELGRRCDEGNCHRCCEQYELGCQEVSVEIVDEIDIPEEDIINKIREINRNAYQGELGIELLSAPMVLEDDSIVEIHTRQELEQLADIKNLNADEDEDNTLLFNVDQILTVPQAESIFRHGRRSKRSTNSSNYANQWPSDRKMYYMFDKTAASNPETVYVTREVINDLNENSCVRMEYGRPPACQNRNSRCNENFIVIGGRGGCASNVGMVGGAQAIHLGPGCASRRIVKRNIGNALGVAPASSCGQQPSHQQSFCQTKQINQAYCPQSCGQQENQCWNRGYANPGSCNSCVCPPTHAGPKCETPRPAPCDFTCPPPPVLEPCQECPPCYQQECPPCRPCEPPPPVCTVSEWGQWTGCSATCGGGTRSRHRQYEGDCQNNRGLLRGQQMRQQERCGLSDCSHDCEVSDWGVWTECPQTCGTRCEVHRFRFVTQERVGHGAPCPNLKESRGSHLPRCPEPRPCLVSDWSSWSQCSHSCGPSCRSSRHRSIKQEAENDGRPCVTYRLSEETYRSLPACPEPPRDCRWSTWTAWTRCEHTCGSCTVSRWRNVEVFAQFGGRGCYTTGGSEITTFEKEVKHRDLGPCQVPTPCVVQWTEWSQCTRTCGHSCTRTRDYTIISPAVGNGLPCSSFNNLRTKHERLPKCSQDCRLSEWSQWSGPSCNKPCGGYCPEYREKSILQHASGNGKQCGQFCVKDQRVRNLPDCAQDNFNLPYSDDAAVADDAEDYEFMMF